MSNADLARVVMERCDVLGSFSEESECLIRQFATPSMRKVNEIVATWMRAAGMTVHMDAMGNLVGRYEARQQGARTLLLGSHLDTVRGAGKYDGVLGVMVALACVEQLHRRGERLPFALEVFGFADEEGLRYNCAYLGSSAVAGTFDEQLLAMKDGNGVAMEDALRAFGGNPAMLSTARRRGSDLLGYCEVHIEQGPILEAVNAPVGVVSAIAGQSRITLNIIGEAGHAGTVPMVLRYDAMCAAAEFILVVESHARSISGLVATVGRLKVEPGVANVIPGNVLLSLDVRHQDDAIRRQACQWLKKQVYRIAEMRRVTVDWLLVQENRTIACAPRLQELFVQTIEELGYPIHILPSGAGHDGVMLSTITNIAMLFVRCRKGISHTPAEAVAVEDVGVACAVLERFLLLLAQDGEK